VQRFAVQNRSATGQFCTQTRKRPKRLHRQPSPKPAGPFLVASGTRSFWTSLPPLGGLGRFGPRCRRWGDWAQGDLAAAPEWDWAIGDLAAVTHSGGSRLTAPAAGLSCALDWSIARQASRLWGLPDKRNHAPPPSSAVVRPPCHPPRCRLSVQRECSASGPRPDAYVILHPRRPDTPTPTYSSTPDTPTPRHPDADVVTQGSPTPPKKICAARAA